MDTLNLYGVEDLTLEEMRTTDGGILPLVAGAVIALILLFGCSETAR
jgi:lactobin A/cerein 7B family class IIb bacteriocin